MRKEPVLQPTTRLFKPCKLILLILKFCHYTLGFRSASFKELLYFQQPRICRSSGVGLPEFHLSSWLWAKGTGWTVLLWSSLWFSPLTLLICGEGEVPSHLYLESLVPALVQAFLLELCLSVCSVPGTAGSTSWLRQPMSCDRAHMPLLWADLPPHANRVHSPITKLSEVLLLIHKRILS